MKKYKFAVLLIAILCIFSVSVSAEKITDLGDSGIISIALPDGFETATRTNCSLGLLDMLKTTKTNIEQSMAAGNLYVLSFGNDGKSVVQYTLSSQNNSGIPGGNINTLTSEQFSNFTTNIKSVLQSDGVTTIENSAQIKFGEYSFLCLDGFTNDEVNGSKLYFRTYATVQSDKLVMLRAMNYSMTEFDEEQKKAVEAVAQSISFAKEAQPVQNIQTQSPTPTEQIKTEPEKKAPEQTQATNQVVKEASTATPQATAIPEQAATHKAFQNKMQSSEKPVNDATEKSGIIVPIISIIIVIAAAVIFIVIKKKKK